jgi:ribulose-phosphate 3-epimerase
MTAKIAAMRSMIDASGAQVELEVDGGIHSKTAGIAVGAGADVLVAGSALFLDPDGIRRAMEKLRSGEK